MLVLGLALLVAAPPFEVAAWVDHFDFCGPRDATGRLFDTETAAGCARILDHVQETGATTILWRNCGGGTMRYRSQVEAHHHDGLLDKRRGPATDPVQGWVRYGEAEPDILAEVVRLCRARGLKVGVHWPFEENHFGLWTIGGWNLEHPQFWSRDSEGRPWWGRASLAYPEVREHKLALLDELIARGIEVLFIDFWRSGGWTPADEHVPPLLEAYRRKYGAEPGPGRDPRLAGLVAEEITEFLREVRRRLQAAPRPIELYIGIDQIAPIGDQNVLFRGADWRRWLDEGLVDTLVIHTVAWKPPDAYESTRSLGRQVMAEVAGRCRVLWPVRAYDFGGLGLPSYVKVTGEPVDQIAGRLTRMAWEEGAAGISLECVDYNNYPPAVRKVMRELAGGDCRAVREPAR